MAIVSFELPMTGLEEIFTLPTEGRTGLAFVILLINFAQCSDHVGPGRRG